MVSLDHLKDGIPASVREGIACHSRKLSKEKLAEVWQRDGNFCPQIHCSTSWLHYFQLPTLLPLQFLFSSSGHVSILRVIFPPSLNNALCFQFTRKLLIIHFYFHLFFSPLSPIFLLRIFSLYIEICVVVYIGIYTELLVSFFEKHSFS